MSADQRAAVQQKTFTKWVNKHLKEEWGAGSTVTDIISDWETGINFMKLAVALYKEPPENHPEQAVTMPKLKERELNPTSRIQKVTNNNTAIDMYKQAGCKMSTISAENLVDHEDKDRNLILGMIFMIILDYSARGFGSGGTAAEVKRALLEWVNKKTEGYEQVNPPGVKNLHKDWRNGLAWCALIHRHRPELLDYQSCIGKSNAENLQLAFTVADESLNIPQMLDVEDMDVDMPDEKSVLTYTMEYFLRFANESQKETAGKQAAEWLKFLRDMYERQNDYERRARALKDWTEAQCTKWQGADLGSDKSDALNAFSGLRNFVTTEKPPQEGEKMDVEALFVEIQTTLAVNGLAPYVPPEDVKPEMIEAAFGKLANEQAAYATRVRDFRFSFIDKKEDSTSEEIEAQIMKSFNNYDGNSNGVLNKKEFTAACMEMGIAFKTNEEKEELFNTVSGGKEDVDFEAFKNWMVSRMIVKLDDPDSIKSAFKVLADGSGSISEAQLGPPLDPEDKAFMIQHMTQNEDGTYDYASFVTQMMPASNK